MFFSVVAVNRIYFSCCCCTANHHRMCETRVTSDVFFLCECSAWTFTSLFTYSPHFSLRRLTTALCLQCPPPRSVTAPRPCLCPPFRCTTAPMNGRQGLPTHPSLPRAPHLAYNLPQAALSTPQSPFLFLFSQPGGYMRWRSIICVSTDLSEPVNEQPGFLHRTPPGWAHREDG